MPRRSAWLDEVDLSSDIDKLYLNGDKETLQRTLNEFKKNKGLKSFRLASSKNIDRVIEEISQLGDDEISPSLFNDYSDNLRKAVDQVFKRNNGNGLDDQLRANVSRFAAYKAMLATGEIREQIKAGDMTRAKMAARAHNRTQATEYNTTISRSRTAKQFEQFNQSDNRRLFPNLRWLPSRSADPRELHMLFWDKVWSKDDDFWNENTPGSLWNCKCDWEETNDPVTKGNPQGNKSAKGLCGNPAKMGEVFTTLTSAMSKTGQEKGYIAHPYFKNEGVIETENMIAELFYKDSKSKLMINAIADPSEITENIKTGRILAEICDVKIAPHFSQMNRSIKNPEFIVDGYIADAKRIQSERGISAGFKAAVKQGCEIVILDYDYNNVFLRANNTASHIANRNEDFESKKIKCCYIVKNGKAIKIDANLFQEGKDRYTLIGDISLIIQKAMK